MATIAQVVQRLKGAGDPTLPPRDPTEPWRLAQYPRDGTSHVLLDGWLSVGNKDHTDQFAAHHLKRVNALDPGWRWQSRVKAFSYSEAGQSYDKYHTTMRDVEEHVENLTAVLASRRRWVITAYSLGAAIAAITLGRLSINDPSLRTRVPLVIFVAPGFYGGPALMSLLNSPESPLRVLPPIAIDLGDESAPYPEEARNGIDGILDAGVGVAVIYSSHDEFAPYRRQTSP